MTETREQIIKTYKPIEKAIRETGDPTRLRRTLDNIIGLAEQAGDISPESSEDARRVLTDPMEDLLQVPGGLVDEESKYVGRVVREFAQIPPTSKVTREAILLSAIDDITELGAISEEMARDVRDMLREGYRGEY